MPSKDMDLVKEPLPSLFRKIAVPASMGFFFNTMNNVVDTFYTGLISTQALASISLSFPVYILIIALGSGILTGATALISNALGERDREKARLLQAQGISFTVMAGIIISVLGLMAAPAMFSFLGAEGVYLEQALSYINIIFIGTVFILLVFILNAGLRARGDTVTMRNLLIAGFLLNLVLDPWFMFGGFGLPAMGLQGVAWATVVIHVGGVAFMSLILCRKGILCRDSLRQMAPKRSVYMDISRQGFPASINMMTVALGIFIITYFAGWFGKEAVAAYGIATRIEQIALLPAAGLNIAALSICGQNNGARRFGRVRDGWKLAAKYGIMIVIPSMFVVFFFPVQLISAFTEDPAVIEFGSQYLRIAAFIFAGYIILFTSVSSLQGIKKPYYAIWIGLYRQLLGPALLFWALIEIAGLGIWGIWYGVFILVWSSAGITILYTKRKMDQLNGEGKD